MEHRMFRNVAGARRSPQWKWTPPMRLIRHLQSAFTKLTRGGPAPKSAPRSLDTYSSYNAALQACGNQGYQLAELVDVVYLKTLALKRALETQPSQSLPDGMLQSLTSVLMVAQHTCRPDMTVLDFGGACGAHYFTVNKYFKDRISFRWAVVETASMVSRARALESDELRFYEDIPSARKALGDIDLVHSAGALQYVPEPAVSLLEITDCGAAFLFLSRLAMVGKDGHRCVVVQESKLSANGVGPMPAGKVDAVCRYPVTYVSKGWLEQQIGDGYDIELRVGETLLREMNGVPLYGATYFARRS